MIRRSVAGLVLGVSLLLASLAWSGYLALRTVLEPDRSREVAEELLDNDQVRDQVARNVASALAAAIPDDVPVADATIDNAAAAVLADPRFEDAILTAFVGTHAAFLGEGDAPENLDLTPLAEQARQQIIAASPELAERIPPVPSLAVDLPTERIPNADPLRSLLGKVVPVLAIAALAGAVFALFTTTDRPSVLRRAGTWALGSTAFYLVIGLGLPWLLRRFSPDNSEVLAALLTAFLRSVVTPSIVLGIVGAALVGVSFMWPEFGTGDRRDDRPAPRRAAPTRARVDAAPRRAAPKGPPPQRPSAPRPAPQQRPAPGPVPTARMPQPNRSTAGFDPTTAIRAPYPDQQRPYQDQAVPTAPANSVFADVGPAIDDATPDRGGARAPRWLEGYGWVLDPSDPRPPPANAEWVDGVGYVIPGPPPGRL